MKKNNALEGTGLKILAGLILFISFSQLVNAETQFFQKQDILGNSTLVNYASYLYNKGSSAIANDYVTGNNPFQAYVLYSIYVQKFNLDNPNFQVDYCNISITYSSALGNSPQVLFFKNYDGSILDDNNAKYFVKLNDGDGITSAIYCKFKSQTIGASINGMTIPAVQQIVTPTWECKACQYYEWSIQEAQITKSQFIGNNIVTLTNYIKLLFNLNFEIWLAFFWLFLILMIFASISLIFLSMYWFYLYLKRLSEK